MTNKQEPKTYGYARVSTDDQSLDLQVDSLIANSCSPCNVYTDVISGVTPFEKRYGLSTLLQLVTSGDTVVVWKLDRLGRSLTEVLKIIQLLDAKGVHLDCIKDKFDTRTAFGMAMRNIILTFAQLERDLISERTKAGLQSAKDRGVKLGAPSTKLTTESKQQLIAQIVEGTYSSLADLAKHFGVSPQYVSNLKAKLIKEEL